MRTSRSRLNTDGRIRVLTDVVVVVVVVAGVAVVVVSTSSGDVTRLEVDKRLDKRVGSKAGRLETLSRRASGLLFGLLIVIDSDSHDYVVELNLTANRQRRRRHRYRQSNEQGSNVNEQRYSEQSVRLTAAVQRRRPTRSSRSTSVTTV